ncbi:AP-4 complex accessory subunit tepsin isoform X1 [Pan troglodytes]|uniref:AP-4 complex accessory subunit tepsin isoform X1 n=1 Tax=Pan troglodytes TaxID=9598 RepID=UPI0023EF74B6|nr:AP-4 complex accessory subunit tepsin isoform X1 [Pan troglodytes]XP_016788632.2 AP-4 complex accessory subunit tepsin isoform X1 [Pan troglodytes]
MLVLLNTLELYSVLILNNARMGGSSFHPYKPYIFVPLPILLKGTSDDDVPCPGYLFEEIAKISHESPGSSQCLLEYLLSRLHSSSGHGKLKVLKILLYLCSHGSSFFLLILKRNSAFIQEAAAFAGPPDPLHGNSLYQKVRAAAQDLGSTLFSDTVLPLAPSQPLGTPPATGMGSQARPHSTLQGFGYSKEHGCTGSAGEAFLSTIQKAAEVVASAMRPGPESPSTQRLLPRGDTYQPAMMPSASHGPPTLGNLLPGAIPGPRAVRHQPGQAGGGWDELDSGPSSQNSSQNSDLSRVSDSGSHSGSDSHSGASREPGDLAERVEVVALSDCQQELSLVRTVTRGPRAFLSREEAQHFIKACGLLNCEAVLQLLTCHLRGTSECTQLRALCAVASLGSSDLLPREHILLRTRPWLQELSMGRPGPVTNKATKILRHFEASCGQLSPARGTSAEPGPTAALPGPSDLLTDAVPLAGSQVFLQPLSSTAVSSWSPAPSSGMPSSPVPTPPPEASPIPAPGDPSEAEARLAESRGWRPERIPGGTDSPKRGPSSCVWSRDSLFAGMELVACPRLVGAGAAAGESCPDAPRAPQTSSQRTAAKEPPGSEPSAFAFLNA